MARRKVSHTGRLSDPIKGSDAHARGLGKQLGAAASEADTYRFIQREREAKWLQLDKKLGLDSSCADIWEKRAKALFHERFALPADSHDWWKIVATALAISSYAGFAVEIDGDRTGEKQTKKWTDELLCQLYADVHFQLSRQRRSLRNVIKDLTTLWVYRKRWGNFSVEALRKAYSHAEKLSETSLLFRMTLYDGFFRINGLEPGVETAIALHALERKYS